MSKYFFLIVVKLILLFLIAVAAQHLIPYLGTFSFPSELNLDDLPNWLKAFANFDGIHYTKIAREGYYEFGQAFFPVYPLLIRLLSPLFGGNHIFAGVLISHISFAIGLYFIVKMIKKYAKFTSPFWVVVFLLSFPTAFFFQTAYTESLFFMMFALILWFIAEKNYLPAALLAGVGSATKLMGIFLFLPFLGAWFSQKKKEHATKIIFYGLFAGIGLLAYMIYLFKSTGDPVAFFHAQSAFGASRSTNLITPFQTYFRYINIFLHWQWNFGYLIALIEFFSFTLIVITSGLELIKRYRKNDYFWAFLALFSLVNVLLPTFTGTLLSEPRFALLSLSSFMYLAALKNTRLKIAIAVIFSLIQIVLFAYFIQGYFVS